MKKILLLGALWLMTAHVAFAQAPTGVPADMPASEGEAEEEAAPPQKAEKPAPEAPKPAAHAVINAVRLQGLNKMTARVSTLEGVLGSVMRFGNVEIIARRCWESPPEDQPEAAALLEIRELRPGEGEAKTIFTGWMFASSPALSALEHPVYDITVLGCTTLKETE